MRERRTHKKAKAARGNFGAFGGGLNYNQGMYGQNNNESE